MDLVCCENTVIIGLGGILCLPFGVSLGVVCVGGRRGCLWARWLAGWVWGGLVPGTGFLAGLWVAVFVVFGCYSDFAG